MANEFLNIVTILDVDYSYEVLKKLELVNEKISLNHIKIYIYYKLMIYHYIQKHWII